LARQFLNWLTTPEAQQIVATTNWMYPITLGTDLPEAFGTPPENLLHLDEADIAANKNAWIEEALAAIR
jgi:thiamine transport system substrate-binding protein